MVRVVLPPILGVFAVADWVAVGRQRRAIEYLCKPAVMVVLVGATLLLAPESDAQRAWFVVALVLSLVGDVFLMLPATDSRFVAGLASFLVAHVAYVVGFGLEPGGVSVGRWAAAAVVLVALGVVVGGRVLAAAPGRMRVPVAAYMVVISVMVATAVGSGDWLAVVGAALFYESDSMIAWNRFVRPFPGAKVAIIVTYHLAQFALVLSLLT